MGADVLGSSVSGVQESRDLEHLPGPLRSPNPVCYTKISKFCNMWEGCRESRKCSRDTYPESYITNYTSINIYRREKPPLR